MNPFERLPPAPGAGPHAPESWIAEVLDVADPDHRGRVKIRLYGTAGAESQDAEPWARVAQAVAGNNRGTYLLPDVGDEVLVTFIGGDPRFPVVIGSLYNGRNEAPDERGDRPGIDRWSFKSRDGTEIYVREEQEGQAVVRVEVPGGTSIEVRQAEGGAIEIATPYSSIILDTEGVAVQASGTVSVDAAQVEVNAGSVTVNAGQSTFSGTVTCPTLVAGTVVATTYMPGVGNLL